MKAGFSLQSTLAAKAAPEVPDKPLHVQPGKPQLQQTSAQQQQRAAEVKELRRLAAVAKKELADDTPWVSNEELANMPLAEQTKRTAVWKARREAVEAAETLE